MNFPKLNEQIIKLTAYLNKREKHADSGLHVVVSPYSISPLGADIAGQGGTALGMTINAYSVLVLFPTKERKIRLYSMNYPGVAEFGLGNIKRAENELLTRQISPDQNFQEGGDEGLAPDEGTLKSGNRFKRVRR